MGLINTQNLMLTSYNTEKLELKSERIVGSSLNMTNNKFPIEEEEDLNNKSSHECSKSACSRLQRGEVGG